MSSLIKARKRKFQEILPEMTRDIRNVHRGQCQACGDCEAFISVSGRVLCDYCGCPPAQHENLASREQISSKKSKDSSNSADLVTADVSSLEIQELDDVDIVDSEDEDHSSSEEAEADEASSLDSSKASSITSSTGSNSSQKSGYY